MLRFLIVGLKKNTVKLTISGLVLAVVVALLGSKMLTGAGVDFRGNCTAQFEVDHNRVVMGASSLQHSMKLLDESLKFVQTLKYQHLIKDYTKNIVADAARIEKGASDTKALAVQFGEKYKGVKCKSSVREDSKLEPTSVEIDVSLKTKAVTEMMDGYLKIVTSNRMKKISKMAE